MIWEDQSGKKYAISAITCIAVVFVWLAPLFWREVEISRGAVPESFENSELYQFVYPALEYGYGRLRSGEIPLWNPYQLCGTPFFADPRVALFQPLNVVFLFVPIPKAMAIHSFICLVLMGTGFTLFLRSLGLGYISAFLGAVVYSFSGASAAAMTRPGPAAALAWTPYCLWLACVYAESPSRRSAVCLGGFLGLCGLSGVFSWFLIVIVMTILIAIVETKPPFHSRRDKFLVFGNLGLAIGLGLSISAAQWIPACAAARTWIEPETWFWSMPIDAQNPVSPRTLALQMFLGKPGALPRFGYMGIATLLLVPAAMFHWVRRKETAIFAGVAVTVLGVYAFFWKQMPLGIPSHVLVYTAVLCAAALAGIGLDRLLVKPRMYRNPPVWHAGLFTVLLASLLFYAGAGQIRGYTLAFLVLLLPALIFRVSPIRVLSGALIALFVFLDLTVASVNAYRHPFTEAPQCFDRAREVFAEASALAQQSRILLSARELDAYLPENAGMLFRTASVGGVYLPLTAEDHLWWRQLTGSDKPLLRTSGKGIAQATNFRTLADLMAAKIIIASPESPLYDAFGRAETAHSLALSKHIGNIRLWENSNAMPRAYWVGKWRSGFSVEDAISSLAKGEPDVRSECILDREPQFSDQSSSNGDQQVSERKQEAPVLCQIVNDSPERVVIQTEAPQRGILVLLDHYSPGWVARVDGASTPIYRANALFRGVPVPAGKHTVEFSYKPRSFVAGAGTSISGIAVALLLMFTRTHF